MSFRFSTIIEKYRETDYEMLIDTSISRDFFENTFVR
jgi:hypothetical protein